VNLAAAQQAVLDRGFDYLDPSRLTLMLNTGKDAFEDFWDWPWLQKSFSGPTPLLLADLKLVMMVKNAATKGELLGLDLRQAMQDDTDLTQPARRSIGGSRATTILHAWPGDGATVVGSYLADSPPLDQPDRHAADPGPLPRAVDRPTPSARRTRTPTTSRRRSAARWTSTRMQDVVIARYETRNRQHSPFMTAALLRGGRLMPAFTNGLQAGRLQGLLGRAEPARQVRRRRREGSHRPAQRDLHRARRDPPARRLRRPHAGRPDQPRRQPRPVLQGRRHAPARSPAAGRGWKCSARRRGRRFAGGLTGGPWQFLRFGSARHRDRCTRNGADTPRKSGTAPRSGPAPTGPVNGVAAAAMPRAGALCVTASVPGSDVGLERIQPAARHRLRHADQRRAGRLRDNPSRWLRATRASRSLGDRRHLPARRCSPATSATSRPATASRSSPPSPGAS
jgi:hypothetical protein